MLYLGRHKIMNNTYASLKKILLLGSSGWIAHYLIDELKRMNFRIIGVSNSNEPKHQIVNYFFNIEDTNFCKDIKNIDFDIFLNMHHSKNFERSLEIHKDLSNYCKEKQKHYVYFSSANAVDADPSRAHEEGEVANGASEYGAFKANCEKYLCDNHKKACIIRFPAAHGFAPNRIARTEEFLKKLTTDGKVSVAKGVYQNRPFVGHLAKMIARIVHDEHSGVFHLGTYDTSDEFDFCTRIAEAFGHDANKLIEGDKYDFNMTVIPKRIYELYGDEFRFTEQDTINELVKCSFLSQYRIR